MCDVDYFKTINDTYGHACGDQVLVAVSEFLEQMVADKGVIARWGGEEFLLIFDKLDYDRSLIAINDIRREIENLTAMNVISLAGLALGVGMLVDNSIVVIENIYRLRNEGMSAAKAAMPRTNQ